jgi:ABC-type phosphate/phosphonate transport system substrate-binding protein
LIRTQIVTAVRAGSAFQSLDDVRGRRLAFIGAAPYDRNLPRKALADQGTGPTYFSSEVIGASGEDALKRLRSQDVDVVVMNADAWQRSCRGAKPQDQPCSDLRVIWTGRPRASKALAVRLDMPAQLRFRLIGIFVAMHLEAPDAFRAAAAFAPGSENFDAAEAGALSPTQVIR